LVNARPTPPEAKQIGDVHPILPEAKSFSAPLRFHERDKRFLGIRFRNEIQVQRHPGVSIGSERHAADHGNAKARSRKESFDDVQLASEVHSLGLWHEMVSSSG